MASESTTRFTIDTADLSKPIAEWKPLLADRGRRRHLSYSLDFDTRAHLLAEPGEEWTEEVRRLHLENRERVKAGLGREFGALNLDKKIENFAAIGFKPFSVLAHHNDFFDQIRRSFVVGAYYPALVAACTLGERILNHLVLDLRDDYKSTPEYKQVYRKSSFDNWQLPIETLEAWGVLLPAAAAEFRSLQPLRHRSVHFNPGTYASLREDALSAVVHLREIIDQQFTTHGRRPWFIEGTRGHLFIKQDWETHPFIRTYFLPTCPFVGPNFSISFEHGVRFNDHADYGDGDWSDEEFAEAFNSKMNSAPTEPEATS